MSAATACIGHDSPYVWSLRYIDEPILRDRNSDGDTQTGNLGVAGSGYEERVYAIGDANFNVVALADTNGDIVERVTYSAYGVPTFLTPAFGNRGVFSDYEWALLFTGQLRDWALATYHYRNRDYSPLLGRFISRDPLVYKAGNNLYAYVYNAPTRFTDPTGKDAECESVCINGCNSQYPHWWQYPRWVGCVNGCVAGCANQTTPGTDSQVDSGLIFGIGLAKVSCCDDNGAKHSVILKKKCFGVLAGVSASAHVLTNINGKNCPNAYTGYFFEWAAGIGAAGVSGEVGVFTSEGETVTGGGGYIGVGIPAEAKLCYYTIVDDDVDPCGCK